MKNVLFPLALFLAFSVGAVAQTQPATSQSEVKTGTASDQLTKGATAPPANAPAAQKPEAGTTLLPESDAPTTTTTTTPDPFLDVPPMPKGEVSLVGGVVKKIDRVRNRVTIEPFGAKPIKVTFDERTHIFRDGIETTQLGINKGDRVYVDTMLDKTHIFARNINVVSQTEPADARGQLISFNPRNGNMVVRDELSSSPVSFRIDPNTQIKHNGAAGSPEDLVRGSIVAIRFGPKDNRTVAREVSVLATPGSSFTFFGVLTHLDIRNGILAVHNKADNKTYEIVFVPDSTPVKNQMHIGDQVTIVAQFNGRGYEASNITINQARAASQPEQ
jgi:Domain of unknown function (DUF5666)